MSLSHCLKTGREGDFHFFKNHSHGHSYNSVIYISLFFSETEVFLVFLV